LEVAPPLAAFDYTSPLKAANKEVIEMKKTIKLIAIVASIAFLMALTGCGDGAGDNNGGSSNNGGSGNSGGNGNGGNGGGSAWDGTIFYDLTMGSGKWMAYSDLTLSSGKVEPYSWEEYDADPSKLKVYWMNQDIKNKNPNNWQGPLVEGEQPNAIRQGGFEVDYDGLYLYWTTADKPMYFRVVKLP
jgi:hypothetical protein